MIEQSARKGALIAVAFWKKYMTLDDASLAPIPEKQRPRRRSRMLHILSIIGWSLVVLAATAFLVWGGLHVVLNMRGEG